MQGPKFNIDNVIDLSEELQDKIEIPCKDLDIDCLPDEDGLIPFESYVKCYLYDPDQGMCPLVPVTGSVYKEQKEL